MSRMQSLLLLLAWLLLCGSWLLLPRLNQHAEALDIPFIGASLFQSGDAVIVVPTTDEATPLRVMREVVAQSEKEIAELDAKLRAPLPPEPLPPEPRTSSLWRFLLEPPPSEHQRTMARLRHSLASAAIQLYESGHVSVMRAAESEARDAVRRGRGLARGLGGLLAGSKAAGPGLDSGFYVSRIALASLLILGTAVCSGVLARAFRTPPRVVVAIGALSGFFVRHSTGRRLHRPRWWLRLALGLAFALGGAGIAYALRGTSEFDWLLREEDDLRIRVENNCLMFGEIWDWGPSDFNECRDFSKMPTKLRRRVTPTIDYVYGFYEPRPARDALALRALSRGFAMLRDGSQTIVAVPTWLAGVPGLLMLLPIATAAITELRMSRRKRQGCCPSCAYPLIGLPQPRCPECGFVVSSRKAPAG
jgi:hypothetical protein